MSKNACRPAADSGRFPLCEVLITEQLHRRASRLPDYRLENEALRHLSRELASSPQTILQKLVETALTLCHAESAGISLDEGEFFRWRAVAGRFAALLGATMPRKFSPCGVVLDTGAVQLMKLPVRHFEYIEELGVPVDELLLVPFLQGGKVIGTLWVASEDPQKGFDGEHYRVLQSLAEFAAAVFETHFQVSQRKKSDLAVAFERQKLQAIFDESPAALALFRGAQQVFEMVNPVYQALFPERTLTGQPLFSVLPELRGVAEIIARVFETGEPAYLPEYLAKIPEPGGGSTKEYYFDMKFARVDDAQGQPYGVYSFAFDVTAKRLAAQAQAEARESLEHTSLALTHTIGDLEQERELRERFVAALTHDLRTPLSAAKMSAQLLSRGAGVPAPITKSAQRIIANMDRADRMIRDLLDVTRIRAGERIPTTFQACSIAGVVERTVAQLQEVYGPRFRILSGSDATGYWDAAGLERIIENLAGNAIKYGLSNTPVAIGYAAEDDQIVLSVHNEGTALSAAEQRSIFTAYRRSEGAARGIQKGWGIGLMLVKEISEAHYGNIRVESSPTGGTTFLVQLPLDFRKQRAP